MDRKQALLKAAQLYEQYAVWDLEEEQSLVAEQLQMPDEEFQTVKEDNNTEESETEAQMRPRKKQRGTRAGRAVQQQRQQRQQRQMGSASTAKEETKVEEIEIIESEHDDDQPAQGHLQQALAVGEGTGDFCPEEYEQLSRAMAKVLRYGKPSCGVPSKAALPVDQLARLCNASAADVEGVVDTSMSRGYPRFVRHGRLILAAPRG